MSISEYNNQTILTIKDVRPVNDDFAKKRGNSLRLLGKSTDVNEWFECRNVCLNNPDCVTYKFEKDPLMCKIYRKEPYKEIKNLSLEDCKKFCSRDNDCDFLSHSVDNKCNLFTREKDVSQNNKSRTSIGKLWVDYPVYGLNMKNGIRADSFEECKKKLGTDYFVYYDDVKYCIPKRFFQQSVGETTIYFDKKPVDRLKVIDDLRNTEIIMELEKKGLDIPGKFLGLNSPSREFIDKFKVYAVVLFIILLVILFYFIVSED